MMNAIIFETKEAADEEARKVSAWANANRPDLGLYISIPVPYRGQWAVTVPDGYPTEADLVDVNKVEEVAE
ncbi:MAG: hypothetical protein ACYDG4_13290 [Desulfuromonadaceae bacterium]